MRTHSWLTTVMRTACMAGGSRSPCYRIERVALDPPALTPLGSDHFPGFATASSMMRSSTLSPSRFQRFHELAVHVDRGDEARHKPLGGHHVVLHDDGGGAGGRTCGLKLHGVQPERAPCQPSIFSEIAPWRWKISSFILK